MTYVRHLCFCAVTLATTCIAISNCSEHDDHHPPPSDPDADLKFEDVRLPDSAAPPTAFQATIIMTELKSQPKQDIVPKVFPAAVVQARSTTPTLKPTAKQEGALPFGGTGCVGYKNPKISDFADVDMGQVTIEGFSGSLAQITCARPNSPGSYGCNPKAFPQGGMAFRYGPVADFINPGDKMVAWATGGKEVGVISKNELTTSGVDNLDVTTDLWAIAPSQVDGSQDLTIEYKCGSGACSGMSSMTFQLLSTDGTPSQPPVDAGSDSGDGGDGGAPLSIAASEMEPYTFPFPKSDFGMVICQETPGFAGTSFKIEKQVLAVLGNSWTRLYTHVAPINTRADPNKANDRVILGSGNGVFGISKRR